MRYLAPMVFLLLVFVTPLCFEASAQTEQEKTKTVLSDAAYILNRYQESVAGLAVDLWKDPQQVKDKWKEAISVGDKNVEREKMHVGAMLSSQHWTSVDLLDVYSELTDVSISLYNLSGACLDSDPEKALELTTLGSRSERTAAKLYSHLRSMLTEQQNELLACRRSRHK